MNYNFNVWVLLGTAVKAFTPSDNAEYFLGPTVNGVIKIACGGFIDWQTTGEGEDEILTKYINISALVEDAENIGTYNELEVSLCYSEENHNECMMFRWIATEIADEGIMSSLISFDAMKG